MNAASINRVIPCTLGLLLFLLVPVLAQEASASLVKSSEETDGKTHRHKTSFGVYDFNVEYRGKIEISDDDQDIISLSDGGFVEISKTVFGSKRSIIIESLGGGKLKKEYYEGRTKMQWEPDGRKWLSEILPSVVRSSALGAESRINRYYKQGGVSAVMSEISRLEGDYTRYQYGKLLLEKDILPNELPSIVSGLGKEINSDYYLATLFKDNISKLMATTEAADAFYKATLEISSDYYKSVVLKEAMNKYSTSPDQVKVILQSAKSIGSDYYLSVVLGSLLDQPVVKEDALNEMVVVSKNISSDYYRSVVLNRVLKLKGVSKVTLKNIADAAGDINSDYYKSTVFNSMSKHIVMDEATQLQVIGSIGSSMNSDYYASVSLNEFLKNQKLSEKSFSELLLVASKLNSSNYATDVLETASNHSMTKSQLIEICKAAQNVDSDHYLTSILTSIAPQVKSSDNEVKDAYRQAAKRIDSETYYGRALRAIE